MHYGILVVQIEEALVMKKKGFTLVEVILAIALIGLISVTFVPALTFGFKYLVDSEKFVVDSYAKQQEVEKKLDEKRDEVADGADAIDINVYGVNVKGHVVTVDIEGHGEINTFQPQRTVTYDVLEIIPKGHSGNPDVLLDVVGVSPRPTEVDMFTSGALNSSVKFLVNENNFTVNIPSIHLVNVYKWFLSSEQDQTSSYVLDNYTVIKEWNAARDIVTYAQSKALKVTTNIQNDPDYNQLKFDEIKDGLSLTDEEMINRFGNRYIYYSVTPFAISGRIGKEDLSNAIYIKAPRIEIENAYYGSNPRQVEVLFKESITNVVNSNMIETNEALGTLVSATRSLTNDKLLILEFDQDLDGVTEISGNRLFIGAVSSLEYGNIGIWSKGEPSGEFSVVYLPPIPVTSVVVTPSSAILTEGDIASLNVTVLPLDATNNNVTWVSDKPSIVSVDATGNITALSPGIATITARSVSNSSIAGTCVVTVSSTPVSVVTMPSGLVLQLDAGIGINFNGSYISSWNDQAGLDNTFGQSEYNYMPGYDSTSINNLPGVTFNVSYNEHLNYASDNLESVKMFTANKTNFTLFVVGKSDTRSGNNSTFFSQTAGNATAFALERISNGKFAVKVNDSDVIDVNGLDGLNLHAVEYNGASLNYRLNKTLVGTSNTTGYKNATGDSFYIGRQYNSGYLSGEIKEVLVFNRDLTATEMTYVENYLYDKWFRTRIKSWEFNASSDVTSLSRHDFSALNWTSPGYMNGIISGTDPYIFLPVVASGENVNLNTGKTIKIRLKNQTDSTSAQFFYTTYNSGDGGFDEVKHVDFPIIPNSDFTEYTIDMTGIPKWSGLLKQLRIDPATYAGGFSGPYGSMQIDYIRIIQ